MSMFNFRRSNVSGQIPFEIYESAYSEEPEEERQLTFTNIFHSELNL